MSNKNEYLPTKCWFDKDGTLHKAFFVYDEDADSPRNWSNLSVIVNAVSKYALCGHNDEEVSNIEEWLICKTGINRDWYYHNYKRYDGIYGLINKFKKQCAAFEFIHVYDHSGIRVHCGLASGWDYSNVGFAYVAKDNEEVRNYLKGHTLKETEEWAAGILEGEIRALDKWASGDVYGCVEEVYDEENDDWNIEDSCWGIFLDDSTCETEEKDAIEIIKKYSGDNKLLDESVISDAIEKNTLDVFQGQKCFDFMEIA